MNKKLHSTSIMTILASISLCLLFRTAHADQTEIICIDCTHELAQIDNTNKTLYVRESNASNMAADFQMVTSDNPEIGVESWWMESQFDWELDATDIDTSIDPSGISTLDTCTFTAISRPIGYYTYTLSCHVVGNDHAGSPGDETQYFTIYVDVNNIAIDSIYTIAYASDPGSWDDPSGWSFPAITYLSGSGLDQLIFKQSLNLTTYVIGWDGIYESPTAVLAEFPGLPSEFVNTGGYDVADSGLTPDWTDLTDFWVSTDGTQAEILDTPQSLSLPTYNVSSYYIPSTAVPNPVVKRFDSGGSMKMHFEHWSAPSVLDLSVEHDWGYWWTNSNSFWFTTFPPTINVPSRSDGFFEYCSGGTRWNPGAFSDEFGFSWQ